MADVTLSITPPASPTPLNRRVLGVNVPNGDVQWATPVFQDILGRGGFGLARVDIVQYANRQTGATWCANPDAPDWTLCDAAMHTVEASHVPALVSLIGWPRGINAFDWAAYARFAVAFAQRYPWVGRYEFWNEIDVEPDGRMSQQQYEEGARIVIPAMKAANASLIFYGPAASWADMSNGGWPATAARDLADLLDVISVHDYGNHTDGTQARLDNTSRYASELAPHWGKPIALTEYNLCASDYGDNSEWHGTVNAVYAAKSIIHMLGAGCDAATWFDLAQSGTNRMGMFPANGSGSGDAVYATWLLMNSLGTTMGDHQDTNRVIALPTWDTDGTAVALLINYDVNASHTVAAPGGAALSRTVGGNASQASDGTITLAPLTIVLATWLPTGQTVPQPPPTPTPAPTPTPTTTTTPTLPALPSGTVVTDSCKDLSHLVNPTNLVVDTTNPQYVGAPIRVARAAPGVQSMTYATADAVAIQATVHILHPSQFGTFVIEASPDGSAFTAIASSMTVTDAGNEQQGYWQGSAITAMLPTGTQEVRVTWPSTGIIWDGQVSQVLIVSAPPVIAPPPAPTPMTLADLLAYATAHGFTGVATSLDGTPLLVIRAA